MWLLIAFIAVPLIEIALFIQDGGAIGLWPPLLIVLVTAELGTYLVRTQGAMALGQLRNSFSELQDPTEPLVHGAMILFAGALLLTPGFFTDVVGLSLLVPSVRQAAFVWMKSKVKVQSFEMGTGPAQHPTQSGDRVIDGEFEDITAQKPNRDGPSEWTRH